MIRRPSWLREVEYASVYTFNQIHTSSVATANREIHMKEIDDTINNSRRTIIRNGLAFAAVGAVAATGLLKAGPARAQASKASQAVAMYQATPHGKDQCDNCIHFIPGKTATANGSCKVVDGVIAPKGWCLMYARKA
ncbi:MAG: high-potential iron-sulfur protein [Rhodanobacter sp.]